MARSNADFAKMMGGSKETFDLEYARREAAREAAQKKAHKAAINKGCVCRVSCTDARMHTGVSVSPDRDCGASCACVHHAQVC